jgi:hypothetical protein
VNTAQSIGIGSERVIEMLKTLPKYYSRHPKPWSLSEALLNDAVGTFSTASVSSSVSYPSARARKGAG